MEIETTDAAVALQPQDLPIPVTVIEPSRGWVALKLGELWEYRELLYFLTWREIKVRYKQTALGAAWAIIQPLFTMLVFSLFFGRLAKVPSDGIPYPLFSLAGLIPWTFFANGLTQSSNSLVASANLISKVYFPRLTIPLSAVLSGAVDFAISFVLLIGMMAFYHQAPLHALPLSSAVLHAGLRLRPGRRPLALRAQRGVPRRALHRSLPDPVLDVRHPHRLSRPACSTALENRSTASIRWSASSKDSAGRCSAPTPRPGP